MISRVLWSLFLVTIFLSGSISARASAFIDKPVLEGYVVTLSDLVVDPGAVAAEHAGSNGAEIGFIYRHALKGYSALMSDEAAKMVSADLRVQSVLPDSTLTLTAQTIPTGVDRVYAPVTKNSTLPGLTINGADDQRIDADIAIIDTGIDNTHPDLNVVGGTDCTRATTTGSCVDGFAADTHGHGTHVAGIAAALDNGIGVAGIAPGARLWAVKVLGTSSQLSSLLAGIDWVTARSDTIEVANVSLKCDYPCQEVNYAISNSVAKGVTYAVAAGNSGADASLTWPANSPDVITVSALADVDGRSGGLGSLFYCSDWETDDTLARFSNFGAVVDVAAPGVCIYSTFPGGKYSQFSGTSMAAPHVAGAAALLASRPVYHGNPTSIKNAILAKGNLNWTDRSGDGTQEPLVDVTTFTPVTVAMVPNQPPKSSFTKSCAEASCNFTSTSSDPDGTISSWSWTFGDGSTGIGPAVTHTYSAAGKYTVRLTVVDNGAASNTASQGVSCQTQKGKLNCR